MHHCLNPHHCIRFHCDHGDNGCGSNEVVVGTGLRPGDEGTGFGVGLDWTALLDGLGRGLGLVGFGFGFGFGLDCLESQI
jgi:hypothetical protein